MGIKINKIIDFFVLPFLVVSIFTVLSLYVVYVAPNDKKNINVGLATASTAQISSNEQISAPIAEAVNTQPQILSSLNLDVPFTTQAPSGEWYTYPFMHTCEEASVLMAHYYLDDTKNISAGMVKADLISMVDFENKKYGFSNDTDAQQTAQLIRDYYEKYEVRVIYNPSVDDIKTELSLGNPVLVPTAGRLLENPHYRSPGPLYHMLVIKGYNSKEFITNDPGTIYGANYKYSYDVFINAMRDFDLNNSANLNGAIIVVSKKTAEVAKK